MSSSKNLKKELHVIKRQLEYLELEARLRASNSKSGNGLELRDLMSFSVVKGMLK